MKTDFLVADLNNLEVEWVVQPKLMDHYSAKLARAQKKVDIAKAKMELVEAELALAMRLAPEKFGLDGNSDKRVEMGVVAHPKFQSAQTSYINAKYKAARLKGVVEGIDQKKKALEGTTQLHGQQYWSKPVARTQEAKEYLDEVVKKHTRRTTRRKK